MKYLLVLLSFVIAGCTTIPARPKWPDSPEVGLCELLAEAKSSEKLSDLLMTVTSNYGRYHECAARVDAWETWYKEQKRIYNESK